MKGLEIRYLIFLMIGIIAFIGIISTFTTVSEGEVVTVDNVANKTCSVWEDRNFPDAATIPTDFDSNKDGLVEPVSDIPLIGGIADCNKDSLETLSQNFYNTEICQIGIGTNEQFIKSQVCNFA